MARINTNVGAVIAQRQLNQSYRSLNTTLERLSSGLRINRGKDDPAGLIVSERLRSEISAVNQAVQNSQRASNIIATTEGALNEVAALLTSVQELIIEGANEGALSEDEIRANQLQIDSAIASITRIANSTTFAGRPLLNGSLDYITSGVNTANITALAVHGAQFGTQASIPVNIEVTQSAQPAELRFIASSVASSVTIEVQGNKGVTTLPFVSGTNASAIVAAINSVSDATGVSAVMAASAASGFRVYSQGYGSKNFVSIKAINGTFATKDAAGNTTPRDEGRDAVATINGAQSIGDGNRLFLKTAMLDIDLNLARTFGTGTTSFTITDGGSLFQLGAHINTNEQVSLGVQSVAASRLGNDEIGFLSQVVTGESFSLVTGKAAEAATIIEEAIRQVSVMRGRLGAFEKNTLDTNVNQLGITMENLMASESSIRDADFAYETAQLTRNQILVNAGTSVLGLANQTPQTVLSLLGGR